MIVAGERSIIAADEGGEPSAAEHAEGDERHQERVRARGARRPGGSAARPAAGAAAAWARDHPQEAQVQVLRHTVTRLPLHKHNASHR